MREKEAGKVKTIMTKHPVYIYKHFQFFFAFDCNSVSQPE